MWGLGGLGLWGFGRGFTVAFRLVDVPIPQCKIQEFLEMIECRKRSILCLFTSCSEAVRCSVGVSRGDRAVRSCGGCRVEVSKLCRFHVVDVGTMEAPCSLAEFQVVVFGTELSKILSFGPLLS